MFAGKLACLSQSFLQLIGTEPAETPATTAREDDFLELYRQASSEHESSLAQVEELVRELEQLDAATLLRCYRNSAHLRDRIIDAGAQILALHRICCGVILLDLRPAAALLLQCRDQMDARSRAVEATLVKALSALQTCRHYAMVLASLDATTQKRMRQRISMLAI
jgi:hypothetical protein